MIPSDVLQTIKTLIDLGASGLLALAVIALYRGWVLPKTTVDQITQPLRDRVTELVVDRDEWRVLAQDAGRRLEHIGDLLDMIVKAK